MLGSLLDKVQSLFTTRFALSSLLPLILFFGVNGALAYWHSEVFRAWVDQTGLLSLEEKSIGAAMVLLAIGLSAYMLGAVQALMRETLAGKNWPGFLAMRAESVQRLRRDALLDQFDKADRLRRILFLRRAHWIEVLRNARCRAPVRHRDLVFDENAPAAKALLELRAKRIKGQPIGPDDVQIAVEKLEPALAGWADSPDSADEPTPDERRLDECHNTLLALIDWAGARAAARAAELSTELQRGFPASSVAPTSMGNMASSVWSYARQRYGVEGEFFSTHLDVVIQRDVELYEAIQDTKAFVDLFVSLVWMSIGTTLFWIPVLTIVSHTVLPLLLVGIGGPLSAGIFYRLGVQSYRSFADMLRTGVDLHRIELLKRLHLDPKDTPDEEELQWQAVSEFVGTGRNRALAYKHD